MRRVLLIGFGNPARGDDGLGPALAQAIERLHLPNVTVDSDYQLTVEDSTTIAEHGIVIFADATETGPEPFTFKRVDAREPASFSSHAAEPAEVLALAEQLFHATTEAYILGIRGYDFTPFKEGLTAQAAANLAKAVAHIEEILRNPKSVEIRQRCLPKP